MTQAAGPLGGVLEASGAAVRGRFGYQLGPGANPRVMLERVAFVDEGGRFDEQAEVALLGWSADHDLGQEPALVGLVARRRDQALQALESHGWTVQRLRVTPAWRLAVGLGNRANPYEIGLALHGTYGWPVIPGSTLKGLTHAFAAQSGAHPDQVGAVFGLPRPADPAQPPPTGNDPGKAGQDGLELNARRGTVWFLDALPAGAPVRVARDVLTPHVQPYYRDTQSELPARRPSPPAEYHNPVPVAFLVVDGGSFAVDLAGPDADHVTAAAAWCSAALSDLGAGAKTSAGYGYLQVTTTPPPGDDR